MPPDKSVEIGFIRFLGVTLGLPVLVLLLAIGGRNYVQSVNQRLANPEARSYFRSWVPIPSQRSHPEFREYSILRFALNRYPPVGDGFLFHLTSQLKKENFDFSSTTSSSRYFTQEITNATPLAAHVAADRQFASLFDFCHDLLTQNAFEDERIVLKKYWDSLLKERTSPTEEEYNNYVHYVIDTYTIPALLSFKERRIARAHDLVTKACDRLLLMPPSSFEFEDTTAGSLMQFTFVFAGLLSDETAAALHFRKVDRAVLCVADQLPPSERAEWSAKSNDPIDHFMLSLYLFDEQRYSECIGQTRQLLNANPSDDLKLLSYLLQLRCDLNNRQANGSRSVHQSLIDVASVYGALRSSQYAPIVDYYKQKLSK